MSELSYDNKFTTVELVSDLGLNLPSNNPRIKHTGNGLLNIDSTNGEIALTSNNNRAITVETDGTVGINTYDPNNVYALDVNGDINCNRLYQNNGLLVPPGSIITYAVNSAPDGWLICDGSSVSRTTYSELFAIISTTYGVGNGSTTFSLPNLQGKTIFGLNSNDSDFNSVGETGGNKTVTLTEDEIPSHSHTGTTDSSGVHTHGITDPGHTHNVSRTLQTTGSNTSASQDGTGGEPDVTTTVTTTSTSSTTGISINSGGAHTHSFTTGATGNGNAFSIMNPYMALNYLIKT
jgi:microcystin-dependent protein